MCEHEHYHEYEEKNEKRRALARKYLDDPTNMQNLNELFGLIRPLAVFVMKEHEKIPSLEKDDYMQIADITAWKVLERIRVKPDIIDNFEAYVVAAIRNGYIAEYRKYVFKSLLESKSYTRKNSSLNAAYLYSMEEYVEKIAEKRRAYVRDFRKNILNFAGSVIATIGTDTRIKREKKTDAIAKNTRKN